MKKKVLKVSHHQVLPSQRYLRLVSKLTLKMQEKDLLFNNQLIANSRYQDHIHQLSSSTIK